MGRFDDIPLRNEHSLTSLQSLRVNRDYRGKLRAGQTIEFRPLTVLVGDQGCGKSTLINSIRDALGAHAFSAPERGAVSLCMLLDPQHCKIIAQDFERENARTWTSNALGSMSDALAPVVSHGQAQLHELAILQVLDRAPLHTLLLLDEPETALSPRSCYQLRGMIEHAVKYGHQVIMSCHNPIMFEHLDEIYSVEHGQWMTPAAFLATQQEAVTREMFARAQGVDLTA